MKECAAGDMLSRTKANQIHDHLDKKVIVIRDPTIQMPSPNCIYIFHNFKWLYLILYEHMPHDELLVSICLVLFFSG